MCYDLSISFIGESALPAARLVLLRGSALPTAGLFLLQFLMLCLLLEKYRRSGAARERT